MAINYEEFLLNGDILFAINRLETENALRILDSRRLAAGILHSDIDAMGLTVLIPTKDLNGNQLRLQEIRDALDE